MIEDALLPAAAHLTGSSAQDVLAAAVAAAGDELLSCRPSHVQYRPQSDLVVRYRCDVRRAGAATQDTLLAATTVHGPLPGTVPIQAETPDGTTLSVGVWRWPFDPILTDLATMVTPHLAERHLAPLVGGRPQLEVVAYRPTERAVVRVAGPDREVYVKVIPPTTTTALTERHAVLAAAGVPVPRVVAVGAGWIAMEALVGTTLRDRLKGARGPLPAPDGFRDVMTALAAVDVPGATPVRSRLDDAPHHAAMLATVLPDEQHRIDDIVARLHAGVGDGHDDDHQRPVATVHGDLHEAQLVVDDERVIGLLDIDDVGPGDPLDDVGTLVAHLRFRAVTGGPGADHVGDYATATRDAVAAGHDPAQVDRHVAAVLVGLATGPFRIQQPEWASTTRRVLGLIERHLDAADRTVTVR